MIFRETLLLFCFLGVVAYGQSQSVAIKDREIPIDHTNQYLYLNGSNFTLLDNALRCFKLESIGHNYDSLIRYWYLFPQENRDSIWLLTLKMIELGETQGKKVAKVYTLVWHTRTKDSLLEVSSIKVSDLIPKSGWKIFDRKIISSGLHKFKILEHPSTIYTTGKTFGLSILQCFAWPEVKTFDFDLYGDSKKDIANRKLGELKLLIAEEFNGQFFPRISDEALKKARIDFLKWQ
jgi:hypothetical protein